MEATQDETPSHGEEFSMYMGGGYFPLGISGEKTSMVEFARVRLGLCWADTIHDV